MLDPDDGGGVSPKRRVLSKVHRFSCQKTILFVTYFGQWAVSSVSLVWKIQTPTYEEEGYN
jgi:hypothetical protein